MKRKQAKRSAIFLLELMIAILFFCLASAVCVRLFVKSHTVSEDTRNLNQALNQVSAAAEIFRSQTDLQEFLEQEFTDYEKKEDGLGYLVYYDGAWQPCKEKEARFCLSIEISGKDSMESGHFSMKYADTGAEIYGVTLEKYTGEAMR